MNTELREWLNAQLAKAEQAVKAREQSEKSWSGGTTAQWREAGCRLTKPQRLANAAMETRILVKCRKDVQMWKQVIGMLEEKADPFHCRYCGAKTNKACICGPLPH